MENLMKLQLVRTSISGFKFTTWKWQYWRWWKQWSWCWWEYLSAQLVLTPTCITSTDLPDLALAPSIFWWSYRECDGSLCICTVVVLWLDFDVLWLDFDQTIVRNKFKQVLIKLFISCFSCQFSFRELLDQASTDQLPRTEGSFLFFFKKYVY